MKDDIIECALAGELSAVDDDALEAGICGAASRIAAAMCAFLLAIAEFDRRKVWQRHECLSMAGWLTWRCAISPITAREHVRVATALTNLPQVRAEFASGRLSYSQARAIIRVATPASEESFVNLARVMTAGQLETVLRTFRRVRAQIADDEAEGDKRRTLQYTYDDDGCLVGTFCLPPDDGALFRAAIESQARDGSIAEADRNRMSDPIGSVRADALISLVTAGAHAGGDDYRAGEDDDFLVTVVVDQDALRGEQADDEAQCHVVDGPSLPVETVRRLLCDGSHVELAEDVDGRILDVGRRSRRPNRALRRALRHRDGHCRFPGCDRRRTQAHHITHWMNGGPTSLDNLVSICWRHHRLLHEHRFGIRRGEEGELQFVRPNGDVISKRPALTDLPAGHPLSAVAGIDSQACQNEWLGDSIRRLDWMVEDLLIADGVLDQTHAYRVIGEAS
jgi:hypothetical protein